MRTSLFLGFSTLDSSDGGDIHESCAGFKTERWKRGSQLFWATQLSNIDCNGIKAILRCVLRYRVWQKQPLSMQRKGFVIYVNREKSQFQEDDGPSYLR
jgi:hypothetical protein